MKQKIFALLTLSLFILSCTSRKPLPENVLVIGTETGPSILDPRFATDAISSTVCGLIYPGLLRRDKKLNLEPYLAKSIDQPDDRTYVIHLREGIKFHSGKRLTSADVRFTFETILAPDSISPKKSSFSKIKSIDTPDEHTVIIKLSEVFAPFLGNLTIGIVPEGAGDLTKKPVGAGPFAFSNYERGAELALKGFDGFVFGKPKLAGVIFKIIPDETVRMLALKKGDIHLISNGVTPAVLPWLEEQKNLKIAMETGTNVSYLGFNMEDEILKNSGVRKAIGHAIDRASIIKYLLKDTAVEAESLIAESNEFFNPNLRRTAHDPKLAKKLLDDAGFIEKPDGSPRFSLTYKTSKNPTRKKIAEIIGEQLRQVGIAIEIKSFEWGTFFSDIKSGNFQIYSLTWVGVADPDIYYYIFHSESLPPDGANRGRYFNAELDSLLTIGRKTVSLEKRKDIYRKAQEIISNDVPYVHLWFGKNIAVMDRRVQGFEIYPDESLDSLAGVYFKE